MDFLTKLIDANQLGGWVRAAVAAGLTAILAKSPTVASIVGPDFATTISVLVSGVVVGLWSSIAKKTTA